LPWR